MMEEVKPITKRLVDLEDELHMLRGGKKGGERKSKIFKLPSKSRVKNSHQMKGFASICLIKENGAVELTREEIVDSTVRLGNTFHYVDGSNVLSYKGKPFVIISRVKRNAWNPETDPDWKPLDGTNETKGQKHIMSRMMNESIIQAKKKIGLGISIGLLILLGVGIYALVAG